MGSENSDSIMLLDDDMTDASFAIGEIDLEKMEVKHTTDARRKLEARKDEFLLKKEMQEFDFNFDDD